MSALKDHILNILKLILLILLPFIVLIRGAVFFHNSYGFMPWMCIFFGIIFSAALVFIYITYLHSKFTGEIGGPDILKKTYLIALILVLVYCIPALMFISAGNTKTTEVKKEFRSLHPILRLSISTLLFVEKDLLLTDASRKPEDYKKMGLKTNERSLHYKQDDGYVYAVDIRTKGHSRFRNWLVGAYFKLSGFETLRHVGTADHLHVSVKKRRL